MRLRLHRLLGPIPGAFELLRSSLTGNAAVIAVFVLVPATGLGAFAMPSWAVHRLAAPLWQNASSPLALEGLPGRVLGAGWQGVADAAPANRLALPESRSGSQARPSAARASTGAQSWAQGAVLEPDADAAGENLPLEPTLTVNAQPEDSAPAPPEAAPTDTGASSSDNSAAPPVNAPPLAPGSPHDPTASDPDTPPAAPAQEPSAGGSPGEDGTPAPAPGPGDEAGDPGDAGDSAAEDPGEDKPGKPDKPDKPGKPDEDSDKGKPDDDPGKGKPDDDPGKGKPDEDSDKGKPDDKSDKGKPDDHSDKGKPDDKSDKGKPDQPGNGKPDPDGLPAPGNGKQGGKKGGRRRRERQTPR